MTKRIIVAKDGYNALTETDLRNLKFHSDYRNLKYFDSGEINVTTSGGSGESTVTHSLGYIPFFIGYAQLIDAAEYPMAPVIVAAGLDYYFSGVWADSTKIYFRIEHSAGVADGTRKFYYKIFRNSLGL